MFNTRIRRIILTISIIPLFSFGQMTMADSVHLLAGFRASRVLSSYPGKTFPSVDYWVSVGNRMSQKFANSTPAGVWIVSLYQSNNVTQFNFPSDGNTYTNIQFIGTDQNEAYLSKFDSVGLKVWLQVEPGGAGMDTLIDLVLKRYKHHPCVKGFGIDVEWFFAATSSGGRKVTDAEAQHWDEKVRSYDSTYTIFLKHYGQSWMPPTYRGNILFVDDSQIFTGLSQMVSEYKSWGTKFSPNKVAFQFGYPRDTTWWTLYADPPKSIGDALLAVIPNTFGLFWVDFTIVRVFPMTPVREIAATGMIPEEFVLRQNFPNPFNPSTIINYQLAMNSLVRLKVYDVLGQEVATLVDGRMRAGEHSVRWNAGGLPSGVYLCRLEVDNHSKVSKLVLAK